MKFLVLGGCGSQGRAALYDLSRNKKVDQVTCADLEPKLMDALDFISKKNIQVVRLDVSDKNALRSVMDGGYDVVLDFLPPKFVRPVTKAAIQQGVHLVNTNYPNEILDLDPAAKERNVAIMPECGLDPGIDLVLYRYSLDYFDEVFKLNSYCGGIPEKAACDNPLNYKISWNIEAVLNSQKRDAKLLADFEAIHIPAEAQHDNAFIHQIEFTGLGPLEAIPNGNAIRYAELLNIVGTLRETGRYTLRWPGWCDFWHPIKRLGFLSHVPIKGIPNELSPLEIMAMILAPQLQYKDNEKDLAVMVNMIEGLKNGERQSMICSLLIERDLSTGLMAMNMGVAYPACIAAEMIVSGEITEKGILSPAIDIPSESFFEYLNQKGIVFEKKIERTK
jgi:saccharopine dehydrogenase-like NADP-dependent oxidoreductase